MAGLEGPSIDSRGNGFGLDTRPGFVDSSQNSASAMENIQLRDGSITKRVGHQKLHDDAIKNGCMQWDTSFTRPVVIPSADLATITSSGGWTFEFALRINGSIPTASPRQILDFFLHAVVNTDGSIELGIPANFLTSAAGQIVADTDYFITLSYDPLATGGTFNYLRDGILISSATGVGGAVAPPASTNLEIGSPATTPPATTAGGPLDICELRIWDETRITADVLAWSTRQLDGIQQALSSLEHYWRMDEGHGFVWNDLGQKDSDVIFCYDPFAEGLVSGSSGSIRNRSSISQRGVLNTFNTDVSKDINYFAHANTMTWEFNFILDELPVVSAAWEYVLTRIEGLAGGMTNGIRFSIYSNGGSTDAFIRMRYTDASAGVDDVVLSSTTVLVQGTGYHTALGNTRVDGVSRTFNLYLDGVLDVGPTVGTDDGTGSDLTVGSPDILNFSKVSPDAGVLDFRLDEMRLWTIERVVADILATSTRTLYPGELTDDLVAWWKFEEKQNGVLFSDAPDPTEFFVTKPDLNFREISCPQWTPSSVVAESPCIFGIHNYINNNNGDNDVLVHGAGATYQINETTRLLEELTPFSPSGDENVTSVRFGRSGNRSYFANGESNPWRWDGASLLRAGIELPRGSPGLLTSVGGVGWPAGEYSVGYTYLSTSGDTQYESAMSAVTEFTLGVAAITVTIGNVIASTQSDVDKIQVYITKANGEVLIKAQIFPNDTAPSKIVTAVEDDLIIDDAEEFNHNPPLKFKYMLERDGRMIWAGDDNNPRLFFFSEINFPEYVGPLNSREHPEEITGLSLGPNNELYVFGKTSRTLILGDVSDPRVPQRTFEQGGCLSHHTLQIITPFVYGIGTDGPFRCTAQSYTPIDQIQSSSIRQLLIDDTDKDFWQFAWMSYNSDRKTLYTTIPNGGSRERAEFIPLQVDTGAWTRYSRLDCEGALALRLTAEGFEKSLGSCIKGFVCDIEAEGFKDGIPDADASSFVVDTVDTTNKTITLLTAPSTTGDGAKGLRVDEFNATTSSAIPLGLIVYQDGLTITVDGSPAALSLVSSGDTIFIGVYNAIYATKAMNARTLNRRKKIFRWFETHHEKQSSGDMKLVFERMDEMETKVFFFTPAEGLIDMSISSDGRYPIQISTEFLRVTFGTVEPVPMTVFSYSIPFAQAGVT